MIIAKVTSLDGSTREFETWDEYRDEKILLPYTLIMINLPMYVIMMMVVFILKHGLRKIRVIEKVISLLGYGMRKMEVSIVKHGTKKAKRSQKKKPRATASVRMVTIM